MLPRPRGTLNLSITRAVWLAGILLLLLPIELQAVNNRNNVVCREELSPAHREQSATRLRKITGVPDLKFDDNGFLRTAGKLLLLADPSAPDNCSPRQSMAATWW